MWVASTVLLYSSCIILHSSNPKIHNLLFKIYFNALQRILKYSLWLFSQISIFSQIPNIDVLTLRWVDFNPYFDTHTLYKGLMTLGSPLSVVSTASRPSPLSRGATLCVSSTWEETPSSRSPNCVTSARCPASKCCGWLRIPAVARRHRNTDSPCSAACPAYRSSTTRVRLNVPLKPLPPTTTVFDWQGRWTPRLLKGGILISLRG